MTGGGRAPTARKLVLLLNDVNHPRHAVFIGDFTETVCPEGFLPGHVDIPARGEVVEPAFAFINVLGVENQRKARVLRVYEAPDAHALVSCNIAFLSNLPQGEVHVAARVSNATTSSLLQRAARALFEGQNEGIVSAQSVALRYFPASATVTADGKAAVFIPGIKSVDDIAAIAVKQPGKPLVWRRVTVIRSQN